MTKAENLSSEELALMLFNEESWRQVLSSLVVGFFSRGIYKPDLVSRALEVTGYNFWDRSSIKARRGDP